MKNPYTPNYTLPVCFFEQRPYSSMNRPQPGMMPQQPGMSMPQQQMPPGGGDLAPITPTTEPQALTLTSTEFLNGFLRTQIGKMVRIEFLIGTGTLIDRTGTLLSVGANYLTIRQVQTDDIVVCDFFSIKFITFLL